MIEETVESITSSDVETTTPDTAARTAAHALRDEDVGSLVVLDGGEVVGIVAESDFVALVSEGIDGSVPVSAFMSSPVETITPDAGVPAAAEAMRTEGVKKLPVVERGDGDGAAGELVGMVTTTDLAHYLPRYRTEVEWKGDPLVAGRPTSTGGE